VYEDELWTQHFWAQGSNKGLSTLTFVRTFSQFTNHKGVADGAIGQVDRPVRGWHAIIEASHDNCVDGLALVIAPMGVTLVC
jgi:hypothetical protein